MREAKPSLGRAEVGYRLDVVLHKAIAEFKAADAEVTHMEKARQASGESKLLPPLFAAGDRRMEAGVVAVFAAVAWLELMLYAYAVDRIQPNSYEEHLDRLRLVSRWLILPRLCEGKVIAEDAPPIHALRELIRARNAVIHPRVRPMYAADPLAPIGQVDTEFNRFLSACRKIEATVQDLQRLLSGPADLGTPDPGEGSGGGSGAAPQAQVP